MFSDTLCPRKYVDLIHSSEGKYGNWEPSVPVRLGDYGYVDRDTGAFHAQGNILDSNFARKHEEAIASVGAPVVYPPDDYKVITTVGVKERSIGNDLGLSIPPGFLDLTLRWGFSFGRKYGAALVMIEPKISKFPFDGNLKPLLELVEDKLHGKALVTTVVTCPAYGLIVSKGRNSSAAIGLSASAPPIPGIPLNARAGADVSWFHCSTTGTWKVGSKKGCTYTPIFELSRLKKLWRQWYHEPVTHRDSPALDAAESFFLPVLPPWAPLDEDGNELDENEYSE